MLILTTRPTSCTNYMYQSKEKWEQEWKDGSWDYMDRQTTERSKNAIIGSVFVQEAMGNRKNGTVLDVGCGEGAISDHLLPTQLYVGMDISKEAIQRAKEKRSGEHNDPLLRRKFVNMNAYDFVPTHKFDVIVFSDMLYYLDHEKLLKSMKNHEKS